MAGKQFILIEFAALASILGSAILLPDNWKDYGILAGVTVLLVCPVVAYWHLERARLINAAIAAGSIGWIAYTMWPFNSPFW